MPCSAPSPCVDIRDVKSASTSGIKAIPITPKPSTNEDAQTKFLPSYLMKRRRNPQRAKHNKNEKLDGEGIDNKRRINENRDKQAKIESVCVEPLVVSQTNSSISNISNIAAQTIKTEVNTSVIGHTSTTSVSSVCESSDTLTPNVNYGFLYKMPYMPSPYVYNNTSYIQSYVVPTMPMVMMPMTNFNTKLQTVETANITLSASPEQMTQEEAVDLSTKYLKESNIENAIVPYPTLQNAIESESTRAIQMLNNSPNVTTVCQNTAVKDIDEIVNNLQQVEKGTTSMKRFDLSNEPNPSTSIVSKTEGCDIPVEVENIIDDLLKGNDFDLNFELDLDTIIKELSED